MATEAKERSVNRRPYKLTMGALKVIPMLLTLCAVLNMAFDFFGFDSGFLSLIGGISLLPLLFLYLASYVFCFCAYHRIFLHYLLASNILVWFDYYIGIPVTDKVLLMLHVLLVGVFMFLVLYLYRREKCCKR